ncbi:triose-phosphate isomerase [Candidatus Woesearchaeota archaeon]|nr:triose-phosphate isomerase [Candidatus Woesearchaeota archaeon]
MTWRNLTVLGGLEMALSIMARTAIKLKDFSKVDIAVCPPFTALCEVSRELNGSNIEVGAQNIYFEDKGAFTGEISPLMLKGICKYVIVGHSERRHILNESDELINKKLIAALEHGFTPIFCIGEKLDEREKGMETNVIQNQLKNGLKGISKYKIIKLIIAYEPVWAIGTGKNATPEQAQEMHAFIRSQMKKLCGKEEGDKIRILYGGSVKADNIKSIIMKSDVDGALVGGASLDADGFAKIVRAASEV